MRLIGYLVFFSFCLQVGISNVRAASYFDLSPEDQARVRNSELVVLPVHLERNLLKGAVFKYLPSISPVALTSVFFDYNQQYLFLPGMTSTRVLEWSGTKARVRQRMNPIAFVSNAPPKFFENWFFDLGAYSYDLDEDVNYENGAYTITWAMPQDGRVLDSEERGQIRFEPAGSGTLITYENATEPFMYELLFKSPEPGIITREIQEFLCNTAQNYYKRTVALFVKRTQVLIDRDQIRDKIDHLLAVLRGGKTQ